MKQTQAKWFSKIKHFRFGSQIYQMGCTIEEHVRKEFFLVNLTILGTRNSNANGDLVLDQVRQIIIRAISGCRVDIQISCGISPIHTIVDKKQIRLVSF